MDLGIREVVRHMGWRKEKRLLRRVRYATAVIPLITEPPLTGFAAAALYNVIFKGIPRLCRLFGG